MKLKARNGLAAEDLGCTAYAVFMNGEPLAVSWQQLSEEYQAAWSDVAVLAISIVDLPDNERATLEVSARDLARRLYCQFQAARSLEDEWDGLLDSVKFSWEMAGRHLGNCIDADSPVDVAAMEEKMFEWASNKIACSNR